MVQIPKTTLRPSELKIAIEKVDEKKLPIMIWGPPGVGKSSIITAIAHEQKRKVFDVRLALLDPTDLRGIPYYNTETHTAEWAPASILPKHKHTNEMVDTFGRAIIDVNTKQPVIVDDDNAYLFLDEINAAPPVIQAAAYQLVLDRKIGDYRLPEGVTIIAAGNREGDKAVTFKMPTPLLNRFVHIDFKEDPDEWNVWAIKAGIEPDVVGFIENRKEFLNKFDPGSRSRGFPTPRSWEYVSRLLDRSLPVNVQRALIIGAVGDGAASEFINYREVYLKLPNPAEILDGTLKKMPGKKNMSVSYAMITALSYELKARHEKHGDRKGFTDAAGIYFDFLHQNFNPEYCIMGVRDCLKNFELPMIKAPNWKNFAQDYAKIVIAA